MFYNNSAKYECNTHRIQIPKLFSKSFEILFTKQIFFLASLPFICSIVIWILMFIIGFNNITFFLNQFPNFWIEYSMKSGFFPAISYYILIFFVAITMLIYGIIIHGIFMLVIASFLSPIIASNIHKSKFNHVTLNPTQILDSVKLSMFMFLKTFIRFLILSALCFLLSFIGLGLIGLIISTFIYFNFYCKNLNHEIALNIMSKEEYNMFLQNNKISLSIINILIFIPLYIPLLNLFATTWQIIVLTHFMMSWYEQYTKTSKNTIEDAEIIEL